MIIVRNKPLWLASLEPDLAGEVLLPLKDNSELVRRGIVKRGKLPKISLYSSPTQALSALGPGLKGKVVFLYRPRRIPTDSLVEPSIEEDPLRDILGEYWSLTGVTLDLVETVMIDRLDEKRTHSFYNPRAFQWVEHVWAYHRLDLRTKRTGKVYWQGTGGDTVSLEPGTKVTVTRPATGGYKPIGKVSVGEDGRLTERALFKRIETNT